MSDESYNTFEKIKNNLNPIVESVENGVDSIKKGANDYFDNFTKQENTTIDNAPGFSDNLTNSFLSTNGIIAKFVFVFFMVILFLVLFRFALRVISYFATPPNSVLLIDGLVSGSSKIRISQNPQNPNAHTISRSNNQTSGAEFTWSVWLFIEPAGDTEYKQIFSKGDGSIKNGLMHPNNAPGLYLQKNTGNGAHNLVVLMDDASSADEPAKLIVDTIPLRKWVHVAILLKNTDIYVYVNGSVSSYLKLSGAPKQNYGDVYVGYGTFGGQISNLSYYDVALNILSINSIVSKGPNLSIASSAGTNTNYKNNYLSTKWYESKW